ncbi:MAG: hypothetical protein V5A60_11085 [Haloarculaceae archaeon]
MPDPPERTTNGGRDALFEESLSMKDEAGAGRLTGLTRVIVLFVIVVTLVGVVLVGRSFVSMVGGVDVVLSLASDVRFQRPTLFGGIVLVGLFVVGYGVFSIVGFVRGMGRAFDEEVHARVTDAGITVRREGSGYWESSGVEIPFDDITAVEYADPDESSLRVEFGDWRSPKFFAGRSRDWVRIERADGPAVYVGSDRPVELAETIARSAPDVGSAEPF